MPWSVRLVLLGLLLLGACDTDDPPSGGPEDDPTLGGVVATASPPSDKMDDLERPIAKQLARQVSSQGLRVDALSCPPWDGTVPVSLRCTGWFDGVEGEVSVELSRSADDKVTFDAELESGVIATANLVSELASKGYDDVDCGTAPAYPTDVGSTITCAVTSDGTKKHVVATITDARGGVTISDF